MLFSQTLVAMAALVASATAFVVPVGTADGLYMTTYDEAGNTILTTLTERDVGAGALAALNNTASDGALIDSARFVKRKTPNSSCGTKYNLNHGDCDGAYNSLKSTCNRGFHLDGNAALAAVKGSVVSYMCTYTKSGYDCTSGEVARSADEVTSLCGWYVSGWWRKPGTDVTYGRQPSGTCYCHC